LLTATSSYWRPPKTAVPTRTRVAPSATATSRSWLMPMDSANYFFLRDDDSTPSSLRAASMSLMMQELPPRPSTLPMNPPRSP
jgi:hypothetical protein